MHKPCAEWHSTLSPSVFIALIKAAAIRGCLGYTLPPGGNPATGSEVRLQGGASPAAARLPGFFVGGGGLRFQGDGGQVADNQ